MSHLHAATPPAAAQEKLSWFAVRFERWQEEGERIGLLPVHLEDLSGALGSAAVAFVELDERPEPAKEKRLLRALEELDTAGGAALDAIHARTHADPAPSDILQRAMLATPEELRPAAE